MRASVEGDKGMEISVFTAGKLGIAIEAVCWETYQTRVAKGQARCS